MNTLPVNETRLSEYTTSRTRGFRIDYLIHFAGFFILPFLYYLALRCGKLGHSVKHYFLTAILFLSAAVVIELLQRFIPYRSYNPKDIFYNVAGVTAGFVIFHSLIVSILTRKVTE